MSLKKDRDYTSRCPGNASSTLTPCDKIRPFGAAGENSFGGWRFFIAVLELKRSFIRFKKVGVGLAIHLASGVPHYLPVAETTALRLSRATVG
ncbi:hypothetical protein CEXT_325891 [Caerostris extrusa]|uniref:Uncharacterized protein n=1 Tax=Caerostris extrusa TaxID=172846 RepID=A0AAV4SAB6_CAEEX|nr:hypothetical protein CEXT_325891 [Caerostris extrusa]